MQEQLGSMEASRR